MSTEKTPEQLKAEAEAKAAEKAAAKQAREEKRAADKVAREEAKAKAKADKVAAKEQAKADKLKAKEDAKAAKQSHRMPEQNGVRRPKADTLCGKAWAVFDALSMEKGSPATIGESLVKTREQNLNDGNVRAEYARWRKFHGVSAPASEQAAA